MPSARALAASVARAHQRRAPLRELALVEVGKGMQQQVGDHEVEHRVAEELELFAGAHRARRQRRGVGQRRIEQAAIEERCSRAAPRGADVVSQRAAHRASPARTTAQPIALRAPRARTRTSRFASASGPSSNTRT